MEEIIYKNIIFKEIKDFPYYYISKCGKVYSKSQNIYVKNSNKILKASYDKDGYLYVKLYKNKKSWHKRISRLVAENYIVNPKTKPCVNHINGIRDDNRVKNLEWVTHSENARHSYDILKKISPNKGKFGKNNKLSKKVKQLSLNNNLIKVWDCLEDIKREYGWSPNQICKVCNGHSKTAKGFKWRYFD